MNDSWNMFQTTGSVAAYLAYRNLLNEGDEGRLFNVEKEREIEVKKRGDAYIDGDDAPHFLD